MTPPVAVALTDYDEWYAVHSAAWCHRMAARITAAACERNRKKSRGIWEDYRCAGCGGLDNQPEPIRDGGPVLMLLPGGLDDYQGPGTRDQGPEDRNQGRGDRDGAEPPEQGEERFTAEFWEDDDPEEEDAELDLAELAEIDLESLDPLTRDLLRALHIKIPGEEDPEEEPEQLFVELPDPPERRGKVAVFMGRCVRCDGAMMHAAREWRDDENYRCLNCGWYTSPKLEERRRYWSRIG